VAEEGRFTGFQSAPTDGGCAAQRGHTVSSLEISQTRPPQHRQQTVIGTRKDLASEARPKLEDLLPAGWKDLDHRTSTCPEFAVDGEHVDLPSDQSSNRSPGAVGERYERVAVEALADAGARLGEQMALGVDGDGDRTRKSELFGAFLPHGHRRNDARKRLFLRSDQPHPPDGTDRP